MNQRQKLTVSDLTLIWGWMNRMSNYDLGEILNVKRDSAERYGRRVMGKLGVTTHADAIERVINEGHLLI